MKTQKALEFFHLGNNCAQAVLMAHAEELGLTEEQAKKMTACFGGGMCVGNICGAISSGMLVLGMKNFDSSAEMAAEKMRIRKLGMNFMKTLTETYGTTSCRDIFSQGGRTACNKVITSVCELLNEQTKNNTAAE
ncbi:MAG: C-GCAxxG-C-C family protein [Planctomycetia bacterium]|nr:C-GCAxxG-C-C family protein [Planctomycetia bacterium]